MKLRINQVDTDLGIDFQQDSARTRRLPNPICINKKGEICTHQQFIKEGIDFKNVREGIYIQEK